MITIHFAPVVIIQDTVAVIIMLGLGLGMRIVCLIQG